MDNIQLSGWHGQGSRNREHLRRGAGDSWQVRVSVLSCSRIHSYHELLGGYDCLWRADIL